MLATEDRSLISAAAQAKLAEWASHDRVKVCVYTARPSLPPADDPDHISHSGYSPEAELGMQLLGMDYPLIATGRVQWLAAKVNVPFESVTKPAPIQALAAIGAALTREEANSLLAAHALMARGELIGPLAALRPVRWADKSLDDTEQPGPPDRSSVHVWIVEDGILGMQATHGAIDLLKRSGLDVHAHAIGIAAGGPKAAALAPLSERVLPDVNAALEYIAMHLPVRSTTMKKLVIVESPAKAKTIGSVLGRDYIVRASLGHVRDLPNDELGVDVEHNFKPTYHVLRAKSKTIKQLRAALAEADELYLATDPDREGEAIAWHLLQVLKPQVPVRRVMFHAITPADIQAAFNQPRALDNHLVNAQQARRVLDRLVGYQVSPLLWKSTGGKSAGRVQSVALRLVVDREREIRSFVPQEYWSIHADLAKQVDHTQHFLARLIQIGPQKVGLDQPIHLKTQAEAERIVADLEGAVYRVKDLKTERKARKPWPPFTTSTLQQSASARLHMSPAETMKIAQELYEGVDIGEGKPVGPDHLHAHGLDRRLARSAGGGAPDDHRYARREVSTGIRTALQDQSQERAGSPRSHPPNRCLSLSEQSQAAPVAATVPTLRSDLAALCRFTNDRRAL